MLSVCALLSVCSWWSEAVSLASIWRSILLHMYANNSGDIVLPWPIPRDAMEADLMMCYSSREKVSAGWSRIDVDSGCAREVYVLCRRLLGV